MKKPSLIVCLVLYWCTLDDFVKICSIPTGICPLLHPCIIFANSSLLILSMFNILSCLNNGFELGNELLLQVFG